MLAIQYSKTDTEFYTQAVQNRLSFFISHQDQAHRLQTQLADEATSSAPSFLEQTRTLFMLYPHLGCFSEEKLLEHYTTYAILNMHKQHAVEDEIENPLFSMHKRATRGLSLIKRSQHCRAVAKALEMAIHHDFFDSRISHPSYRALEHKTISLLKIVYDEESLYSANWLLHRHMKLLQDNCMQLSDIPTWKQLTDTLCAQIKNLFSLDDYSEVRFHILSKARRQLMLLRTIVAAKLLLTPKIDTLYEETPLEIPSEEALLQAMETDPGLLQIDPPLSPEEYMDVKEALLDYLRDALTPLHQEAHPFLHRFFPCDSPNHTPQHPPPLSVPPLHLPESNKTRLHRLLPKANAGNRGDDSDSSDSDSENDLSHQAVSSTSSNKTTPPTLISPESNIEPIIYFTNSLPPATPTTSSASFPKSDDVPPCKPVTPVKASIEFFPSLGENHATY